MDKKIIIIILLVLLIPSIILLFSFISEKNLSPNQTELEKCSTLEFNNPSAINLVFFSEKEDAEKYKEFFQQTYPFKENKNAFNFYLIDSYKPNCEIYKGIAILCHSKELIKKAASCPNDFIIVVEDRDTNIRSSSYLNVMSINKNHPLTVLTHEFGHSFANLAEEYTPARIPQGSENCVQKCEDFNYEVEGCFTGCSENNYQRSISNGVMRTLNSNDYGVFNTNLIINRINKKVPSLTGNVISNEINCETNNYYLIEGRYIPGSISLINKTIESGCYGGNGAGNFMYYFKTSSGEVLTENEFNPELIFTDSPNENEVEEIDGETFISERNFLLKVPIISQAEKLGISENDNELIEINLKDIGSIACKI